MRGLHQRQFRILQEGPHRRLQEDTCRHVVAVKDADQLAFGKLHGVVEVTRFGVGVVVTRDVPYPDVGSKHRELVALTVIEQVNLELVCRVVQALRGQHGIAHHVQTFVVGRDIDIHRRPQRHILGQRHNLALKRKQVLQITQNNDYPDVEFGKK